MARPVTVTKEKILSAALDLVRVGGLSSLTARNLCSSLGCGANAIFSSFGSIQGVRDAVREEARKLYRKRVGDGFALNPPFKGFGIAFIWFAMDEPHLFSLIMESPSQPASYKDYIDSHVGFKAESLSAIADTFGLHGEDAETLYYQLILVAMGLASTCIGGKSPLTIPQASEILGKNVRAFLMVIRAGNDEREGFVPNISEGPGGEVDSYGLMQALVGQNHLLQELRARPRYIQDEEWAELERRPKRSGKRIPTSQRAISAPISSRTCNSPYRSKPSCWGSPPPPLPKPASGLKQNCRHQRPLHGFSAGSPEHVYQGFDGFMDVILFR